MADDVIAVRSRRWPRRVLIGVNVFLAVCVVATATAYGYLRLQVDRLPRISGLCGVLRNCGDDDPGNPMNVLLVGSDTRAGLSPEDQRKFDLRGSAKVAGQRADTMMILRVDPRAQKAAILSIPRDLFVDIAGTNGKGRINQAFEKGPSQLIETIDTSLGIKIDHYVQVDFNGFRGIVSAIGGVTVFLPGPVRDRMSGLKVDQGGCVNFDGELALAYVRSRNFQYFESGKWRSDPTGDLGRIQRQQDFVRRVVRKAISRGVRNPVTANRLIGAAVENVTIDEALTTDDILRLGKRFRSLEADAVDMLTIPTEDVNVGGAAVLKLRQPDAQAVIDRLNGTQPVAEVPPPRVPRGTIRVRVLNGTGRSGQATEVSRALSSAGFVVAGIGDAGRFDVTATVITYGAGQKANAELLQAYVIGSSTLVSDPRLTSVGMVITTGSAFGGIKSAAAPASTSSTTSTSAPPKPKASGAAAQPC